ncbi:MAG: alpha/beta hydrolase [Myxococcota bacterium]
MVIALAVVLGGYLALCALLFVTQRGLVYPAPRERAQPSGRSEIVEIPGGTPMLWRKADGDGPVVVHFHGNGEQVAWLGFLAEAYAQAGVSFAAVEYPGYPGAAGSPSEESICAAADAAMKHLTGPMGVAKERLVLEGQSLGSGVAVWLAEQGWGTRLVLLSPYTALPDVGARAFPFFPVRLLMRDRFDSASRAPSIRVPVLVLHGPADEVIPFELGKALAAKFPHARFVEVPGAGHNDLWDRRPTLDEAIRFVRGL